MSVVSLAIVGKNNEPLYLREFTDEPYLSETDLFGLALPSSEAPSNAPACSIRQQFILCEALERLNVHDASGFAWRASGASGADAKFVGFLTLVEDLRVYGYLTNTRVKFIVVVEDDVMSDSPIYQQEKDSQIKTLLSEIHNRYVEYVMNPFNEIGDSKIVSSHFDKAIDYAARSFNQGV